MPRTPARSILVTGGCGFIGSHVLGMICRTFPDANVVNLDLVTYAASLKDLPADVHMVYGSVCDRPLVQQVLTTHRIDTIVHLAAETHVDNSFADSTIFTSTNTVGTHVLLQEALGVKDQIKLFVHVSTDEVYGNTKYEEKQQQLTEDAALCPTNPYAASKVAAEAMVRAYHLAYQLPCIVTRSNNVYGPRQFPEKVIPKFIHKILRGESMQIHGNGSARRSFIFVTDVVAAFRHILLSGTVGETYNIGINTEHTIRDVAEHLKDLMLEYRPNVENVSDRDFNDHRYFIDSSKLHRLGWEPKVGFAEGLQTTIDWYLAHPDFWSGSSLQSALRAHQKK